MGIETVFVIVLTFKSFDQCWAYYHEKLKSRDHAYAICTSVEQVTDPVRPRLRPEGLGKK